MKFDFANWSTKKKIVGSVVGALFVLGVIGVVFSRYPEITSGSPDSTVEVPLSPDAAKDRGETIQPLDLSPLIPEVADLEQKYGQGIWVEAAKDENEIIPANSELLRGALGFQGGVAQSYTMRNKEAGSAMGLSVRVLLFDSDAHAKLFIGSYIKPQILLNVSQLGLPSFSTRYAAPGEFTAVSEGGAAAGRIVIWAVAGDADKSWNHTGSTLYICDDVALKAAELFPEVTGQISPR
jgi:hypothetical protein